ncbi:hypothetical protein RB195_014688 [Necator americanus]|uniref:Uncharacterized protein n=1 Tax=Necator americanus TaxID=51031 RepID=A0ABR1E1L1_NECAM
MDDSKTDEGDRRTANSGVYLEASNKHMRNTTLHTLALCVGSIRKRERRSDMELPAGGAWATEADRGSSLNSIAGNDFQRYPVGNDWLWEHLDKSRTTWIQGRSTAHMMIRTAS